MGGVLDKWLGLDRNGGGIFDPMGTRSAKRESERVAEEQRRLEEQRQAQIRAGTDQVNTAFSQFNDPYYDSIAKAYVDYYMPQLQRQFDEAKRTLTLSSPTTGSSAYARSLGLISKDFADQQGQILSGGQTAAANKRSAVEGQRLGLIDAVNGGMSLDTVGTSTAERVKSATAPPNYEALPDLFSRYVSGAANRNLAAAAGYQQPDSLLFGRARNVQTVV